MFQLALAGVTLVFSAYAIRREIRLTEHFEALRARARRSGQRSWQRYSGWVVRSGVLPTPR
jgi:hypothetical protein